MIDQDIVKTINRVLTFWIEGYQNLDRGFNKTSIERLLNLDWSYQDLDCGTFFFLFSKISSQKLQPTAIDAAQYPFLAHVCMQILLFQLFVLVLRTII